MQTRPDGKKALSKSDHNLRTKRCLLSASAGLICLRLVASPHLLGQTGQAAPDQGSAPVLTLGVQSRLVVEDVLVTDAQGRPVHGLPQSAFHVFDEGKPQTIRSFDEASPGTAGTEAKAPVRALPTGVFSNDSSRVTHAASEVLLIDADDIELQDQMFLLAQLRRAVATLPEGLQVAVFRVSGGRAVEIRGMSTDRDDLRRALGECLPVQTHAIDSKFQSAVDQLLTVSAYLEQTPGRKNVLWFAGSFPLVPVGDDEEAPGGITVDYATRQRIVHQIQEALAEARVSVYPVDVRGVLTTGLAAPGGTSAGAGAGDSRSPSTTSGFTRTPTVKGPGGDGDVERRDQMQQLATATGGKSYVRNDLEQEIGEAFDLGLRAYAITYTPSNYATDDSWHRVRITVDGGYRLSYRQGYLATWTGVPGGRQGFRLEDGKRVSTSSDASHGGAQPLLFTVKVEPEAENGQPAGKKGRLRVTLKFRIAADQLAFVHNDDRWRNGLLVYSYAYDSDGKVKGGKLQELDTALTDEQYQRAQSQEIPSEQVLDVPKDAGYLLMAVRDKRSKRIGTFLLSMRAVRALPGAEQAAVAPVTVGGAGVSPAARP